MKLKKLLCLLLVLLMALCLAACGGSDDKTPAGTGEAPKPDSGKAPDVLTEEYLLTLPESDPSDFSFSSDGDGLRLDSYTCSDTIVIVPAKVDGKPVVSAAYGVFGGAIGSKVKAVRFPDSVTKLTGTFALNENIEIVVCKGLEVCGDMAFGQCPKLRSIVFGDALNTLEANSIVVCESLEELYLGPNVTKISWCFDDCSKLTIVGQAGSYAEQYANENNIPFRAK